MLRVSLGFPNTRKQSSFDTSSRFLLNLLGWDNLSVRRAKQKANFIYKCIKNLCNLFAQEHRIAIFATPQKKLMLPKSKTDYLKLNFSYSGALLWNNLPEEIRTSVSLRFFKRSSLRWFSPTHGKYVKQFLRIFN